MENTASNMVDSASKSKIVKETKAVSSKTQASRIYKRMNSNVTQNDDSILSQLQQHRSKQKSSRP